MDPFRRRPWAAEAMISRVTTTTPSTSRSPRACVRLLRRSRSARGCQQPADEQAAIGPRLSEPGFRVAGRCLRGRRGTGPAVTFRVALTYAPLGDFQFNPNDKTAGTFQFLDNLTVVKGSHTVKFGGDLRWIRSDNLGAQFARGLFTFNGRFTGSSFADFLRG